MLPSSPSLGSRSGLPPAPRPGQRHPDLVSRGRAAATCGRRRLGRRRPRRRAPSSHRWHRGFARQPGRCGRGAAAGDVARGPRAVGGRVDGRGARGPGPSPHPAPGQPAGRDRSAGPAVARAQTRAVRAPAWRDPGCRGCTGPVPSPPRPATSGPRRTAPVTVENGRLDVTSRELSASPACRAGDGTTPRRDRGGRLWRLLAPDAYCLAPLA